MQGWVMLAGGGKLGNEPGGLASSEHAQDLMYSAIGHHGDRRVGVEVECRVNAGEEARLMFRLDKIHIRVL
jgi:hypothetical protein